MKGRVSCVRFLFKKEIHKSTLVLKPLLETYGLKTTIARFLKTKTSAITFQHTFCTAYTKGMEVDRDTSLLNHMHYTGH
jgi:hypothetical protein